MATHPAQSMIRLKTVCAALGLKIKKDRELVQITYKRRALASKGQTWTDADTAIDWIRTWSRMAIEFDGFMVMIDGSPIASDLCI